MIFEYHIIYIESITLDVMFSASEFNRHRKLFYLMSPFKTVVKKKNG